MSLSTWMRGLQGRVTGARRPRPGHRPRRPRCRPAVEHLEGRLVPSAVQTVVYTETNDPTPGHNAVLAYRSDPADGHLTLLGSYLTGGTGQANPTDALGPDDIDQEVLLSKDRHFLFAVNSGSDTVAVFKV